MKKLLSILGAIGLLCFVNSCSNEKQESQKWEYKTLEVIGYDFSEFYPRYFPVPVEKLDTLGSQGWELVDVYTQIQTVHPNFGNDKYVAGLQPNTRTSLILYVFKRPLKDGLKKDGEKHFEEVSADELIEADTCQLNPS